MEETYETFARIYDRVMDEALYEQWLSFTKRHIDPSQKRVLELACGTGALACAFAREGFSVTGLDKAPEMLTFAYDRSVLENLEVQWVAGDMLDLSEVKAYEVVTCYADSLCYMKNRQQVQQVFDEVYQVLEENGTFLFDVHSIYQVDAIFPGYSYHENEEDFAFLWDSFAGEKEHSVVHELTFFVKEADFFQRYDELHEERTYPLEQYLMMLENAGFVDIQVFADFLDEEPVKTSARWFFAARK